MKNFHRRKITIFSLVSLMFFLFSCRIFIPETYASKKYIKTAGNFQNTNTIEASLSFLPTSTPQKSSTPFPTLTHVPTLTSTPVLWPTNQAAEVDVYVEDILDSPGGEWFASLLSIRIKESIIGQDDFMEEVNRQIIQLKLSSRGFYPDRIIEEIENPDSMVLIPFPLAWSQDGKKFFFSHRSTFHDGCFPISYTAGKDLFVYDMENERLERLLDISGFWMILSADTNLLAYLDNLNFLVIRDLSTGMEKKTFIVESENFSGKTLYHTADLVWSPDNRYLAYTFMNYICGNEEDVRHSIIIVSADTLVHRTLIDEDENCPRVVKWQEDGLLLLKDENENYYTVDPQINK